MPNQRADTKKCIGAYVDQTLYEEAQQIARKRGLNFTELLEGLLIKELERAQSAKSNEHRVSSQSLGASAGGRNHA